ncbi:zinc finger MYM-type protein 1-like [Vigna unguiculata]|uniref:zinc finger MYM-type protein 1-like n=1 Tax=Vigna unguiculata TaxID=3917 RepID=UPI0010170671|nr:zinc finger MYM-type protein 1-like [Vigna unguiculata]
MESPFEFRALEISSRNLDRVGKLKSAMTRLIARVQKHDTNVPIVQSEEPPFKVQKIIGEEFHINSLECETGKRLQIWEYPMSQRDEIQIAYLKWGPYQMQLENYPYSKEKHPRRFQSSWFKMFPSWLEYSPANDEAYCLACYLFSSKPDGHFGSDVFTKQGFRSWRKVNAGKRCAFLNHIGDSPWSPHNNAMKACEDLLNQSMHINNNINIQSSEQVCKNCLRLKTSIDTIRWLAFQACAFKGHEETPESSNKGNFLEMIKLLASYNDKVAQVVLENAPYNAKNTSHHIQKEILHIFSRKVRSHIREEIGDSKFCIIVDEARDESKKEQMAIVLRFVDKDGYDGVSNMMGEWNGLQALFLNDNPYAYYVHCFAHRLQLALVAASREVIPVHQLFSNVAFIVNVVYSSSKRHDELQAIELDGITQLLEMGELETGKGKNQIGTLKRVGDTRWSSHFYSICSMMKLYNASCLVLQKIIVDGSTYSQRGDVDAALNMLSSFEFILILQ